MADRGRVVDVLRRRAPSLRSSSALWERQNCVWELEHARIVQTMD